ncbi:MAG: response regulator transcription factor [Bacteroidota bacterium]
MKKKLNLIVTDDHTLFRRGMVRLVSSFDLVNNVAEASNGKELLKMLKKESFDLVLLDLEMPMMDGYEAANQIIAKFPGVKIIMVSMHASENIIYEMIETGIHSYLIKNAEPDEVYAAIKAVMDNDFYYNKLVAKSIQAGMKRKAADLSKPSFLQQVSLTGREIEVLRLICNELTMKEIGEKLNLSDNTIQNHRTNLLRKTGAKNTVGLVRYAFENQLL